jgi:hypothetical protein
LAYENKLRNESFLASRLSAWSKPPYSYIKPKEHKEEYLGAFESLKKQAWIPFEGPVTLDDIFNGYIKLAMSIPIKLLPFSNAGTPSLVAAWAGEFDKAEQYLDWGCKILDEDDKPHKPLTRADFRKFHEEMISDPEYLRQLVEDNIANRKDIQPAPYQDIAGAAYKKPKPGE